MPAVDRKGPGKACVKSHNLTVDAVIDTRKSAQFQGDLLKKYPDGAIMSKEDTQQKNHLAKKASSSLNAAKTAQKIRIISRKSSYRSYC